MLRLALLFHRQKISKESSAEKTSDRQAGRQEHRKGDCESDIQKSCQEVTLILGVKDATASFFYGKNEYFFILSRHMA